MCTVVPLNSITIFLITDICVHGQEYTIASSRLVFRVTAGAGFVAVFCGLSTNLYAIGVQDMVIQVILRHAKVAVPRKHCIKTSTEQAKAAMKGSARKRVRKTVLQRRRT